MHTHPPTPTRGAAVFSARCRFLSALPRRDCAAWTEQLVCMAPAARQAFRSIQIGVAAAAAADILNAPVLPSDLELGDLLLEDEWIYPCQLDKRLDVLAPARALHVGLRQRRRRRWRAGAEAQAEAQAAAAEIGPDWRFQSCLSRSDHN